MTCPESEQEDIIVTLDKLRLKAFASNFEADRAAYFDRLSRAYQREELVSASRLLGVAQAGKVPADELAAREVDAEFARITGLLFDALKQNKALQSALKPFAAVAESDIGQDETDADIFQPMRSGYNREPLITVGDLRRASLVLSSTHYRPEEITGAEMDAIEAAAIAGTPLSSTDRGSK